MHAGLWTSAALRTSAEEVPVLRTRLAKLDQELGFAPSSHAAKALAHAISTLPHDLLISFNEEQVRAAALTAMSLADRPRPKLLLLPGALRRHVYAFVWLPREELTHRAPQGDCADARSRRSKRRSAAGRWSLAKASWR